MKRLSITIGAAFLVACTILFASETWSVFDCFNRDPLIGHDNGKVTTICKFCGWRKVWTWKEWFWGDTKEDVLMRHIEAFHSDDIRRACTNAVNEANNG